MFCIFTANMLCPRNPNSPSVQTHTSTRPVNYHCPVCQKTDKTPNMAGRFFIINLTECQCNGCGTVFDKSKFYKPVIFDAEVV